MDLVEVLSFLFTLSTSEVGRVCLVEMGMCLQTLMTSYQDYTVENLTPTQLVMLEDLRDYGLVWQRKVPAL